MQLQRNCVARLSEAKWLSLNLKAYVSKKTEKLLLSVACAENVRLDFLLRLAKRQSGRAALMRNAIDCACPKTKAKSASGHRFGDQV